jgi:uncharacterized membrane protein YfcA
MLLLSQLLFICPLVFFAGLVDSMVGGGGLISLPAYFAAGLPPHAALGTNKFVSSCGTTLAAARFWRGKKIHTTVGLAAGLAALPGSFLGARAALYLDPVYIQYMLVIGLPIIAGFILMKKDFLAGASRSPLSRARTIGLSLLTGFFIGAYDGFFGPGTGTFLILVFNLLLGLDLLSASGTAKIVNLASNLAALVTFFFNGSVIFTLGIPAAGFCLAGNYIGSGLALRRGVKIIRPAFIVVFFLLLLKVGGDLFFN